jgi:hypothetical protein
MSNLVQVEPEYIYVTIPAEYICVYHRILAMLADYGEEMLKDCKASCTDRNSGVIECFNMFNAAVAARKLGKDKLAETLIKYIKAKINQIYKNADNSTSFVFPIDENGQIKAFVSCGERPRFEISPDDMNLYEHKFDNGFDEHFKLGPEDESKDGDDTTPPVEEVGLVVEFTPDYHIVDGEYRPCGDLIVRYDGEAIDPKDCVIQYYFDDVPVMRWNDVTDLTTGEHNFKVVVTYNNETKIVNKDKYYANTEG